MGSLLQGTKDPETHHREESPQKEGHQERESQPLEDHQGTEAKVREAHLSIRQGEKGRRRSQGCCCQKVMNLFLLTECSSTGRWEEVKRTVCAGRASEKNPYHSL